jgi:hypothetical protein
MHQPSITYLSFMITRRIRLRQSPAEAGRLLESFMSGANLLPTDFRPVRDPTVLPAPLQVIVVRASQEKRAWACWTNALDTLLFTCELSRQLSRRRGATVIIVNRYREHGELEESAPWMVEEHGGWLRCPE